MTERSPGENCASADAAACENARPMAEVLGKSHFLSTRSDGEWGCGPSSEGQFREEVPLLLVQPECEKRQHFSVVSQVEGEALSREREKENCIFLTCLQNWVVAMGRWNQFLFAALGMLA